MWGVFTMATFLGPEEPEGSLEIEGLIKKMQR